MRGGWSQDRRRPLAGVYDINITPLLDVLLVLLVVFMVVAPLLQAGVHVDIAESKSRSLQSDDTKMTVTVTRNEHVYLGKEDITRSVEQNLRASPRLQEEKELYIQADEAVQYRAVLRVMAAARTAGIEKLGMVTDPVVSP